MEKDILNKSKTMSITLDLNEDNNYAGNNCSFCDKSAYVTILDKKFCFECLIDILRVFIFGG